MSFANFMNKLIWAIILTVLVSIIVIISTPAIVANLTANQKGLITLVITYIAVIIGAAIYVERKQFGTEKGRRRIADQLFNDAKFKLWFDNYIKELVNNKTKSV